MLKLRTEDTAITARPADPNESADAISINSDNLTQSPQTNHTQSTRQRNPSVSSSCPSINQDTTVRQKGYESLY